VQDWVDWQARPHVPQFRGSVWTLTQSPRQEDIPAGHAPPAYRQTPAVQTPGKLQTWPHAPQLLRSDSTLMQAFPQFIVPVGQLATGGWDDAPPGPASVQCMDRSPGSQLSLGPTMRTCPKRVTQA
jgi:hypothetical protein